MSLPLVTASSQLLHRRHCTGDHKISGHRINMRSHGWRQLRTANSKRTSGITSCGTALKRNQFSVHNGTMMHIHPTSGQRCSNHTRDRRSPNFLGVSC